MKPKDCPTSIHGGLTIPTNPAWFGSIRNLIISISRDCGFSNKEAGSIGLAVDEALSNVHRHGYDCSTEETLDVSFQASSATTLTGCKITICIEDRGKQVDIDEIRSRDLQDVRPGGLGVHLIQSVMDEATWSHRKSGGMRLILGKQGTKSNENSSTSIINTEGSTSK